jgi:hypothetical protein
LPGCFAFANDHSQLAFSVQPTSMQRKRMASTSPITVAMERGVPP